MAKKLDTNTKELILKASEDVIAKSGPKGFSLRDVAKHSSISLGTLYYYYKSKHDLIMDLASLYLTRLNKEYFDWLKRHKHDLTSDRFLDVIFTKGVKLFERGNIHVFLLNECIKGDKELQVKFSNLYKTWKSNLKVGIKQVFPNVKESEVFASLLMMIVDGMIFQELLKLKDNVKEEKIKALLKGLSK